MKFRFSPRILLILVAVILFVMLFMNSGKSGYITKLGSAFPSDFKWNTRVMVEDNQNKRVFMVDRDYVMKDANGVMTYVDKSGNKKNTDIPLSGMAKSLPKGVRPAYPFCYSNTAARTTTCLATNIQDLKFTGM
jgi:hypothetical protein